MEMFPAETLHIVPITAHPAPNIISRVHVVVIVIGVPVATFERGVVASHHAGWYSMGQECVRETESAEEDGSCPGGEG